jgi:hypothetical protein
LLLQFENLLRKRVYFGVLFINLFCERFKLRGVSRPSLVRDGVLRKRNPKRERAYCAKNADYLHRDEILPLAHLSDKQVRQVEKLFLEALANRL